MVTARVRHRLGHVFMSGLLVAVLCFGSANAQELSPLSPFRQHSAMMLLIDPETGRIIDANNAAIDFYGYPHRTLIGKPIDALNILGPAEVEAERKRAQAEERSYFIFPHRLADGQIRTVEVHSSPLPMQDGRIVLASILHDISGKPVGEAQLLAYKDQLEALVDQRTREATRAQASLRNALIVGVLVQFVVILLLIFNVIRKRCATAALAQRERQLKTLIDAMPDIIRFKDGSGRWQQANRFALRLFGLEGVDYRNRTDAELVARQGPNHEALLEDGRPDARVWASAGAIRTEERLPTPDGGTRIFDTIKVPLFNPDGSRNGLVEIGRDITERKHQESEIERLAYFDSLTGLPNRRMLLDRLHHAIALARRNEQIGALMFVDLDHFKTLNDARGHDMGDRLLKAASARLIHCLRDSDTVARFGGDEFVLLLPALSSEAEAAADQARSVAEKIRQTLTNRFELEGEDISVSASIGVTLFPGAEDERLSDLLKQADTAMYQAKEAGRNHVCFFEPEMQARAEARFALEADLRNAIDARQLRLYLQPQVDCEGTVRSAEALLRWHHPVHGLIPPGAFIPIAEETGLIADLGQWVLRQACGLLARAELADPGLSLSVNVSPRQFHRPDFVPRVRDILVETGADPARLTLEVTEGLLVDAVEPTVYKMAELRRLGVRFSIDDFGTGYSSLAYLKRLPISELKIDATFIQDAPTDPDDAALVDTILAMASHLRLNVVAEGVETREQAEFLRSRTPILYQGYLFGRPEPAEVFLDRRLRRDIAA